MTNQTTYKNYSFFPEMKAAAAAKYGADGFLVLYREYDTERLLPPTWEPNPPVEQHPDWENDEIFSQCNDIFFGRDDVFYTRDAEDRYVSGECSYQAVANPGWPLTIDFQGREYTLFNIAMGGDRLVALYRPDDPTADGVYAVLTDSGLDVWSPRALESAR